MVAENDDQFLKTSLLEVLVPQATNLNINKLLPPKPENCDNVVSSVERRDLLYFDELVTAYIILRTRNQDEDRLKSYLPRLAISLEVQAHGLQLRPSSSQNASTESFPSRTEDTLWSGDVDTSGEPITIWPPGEERHSADYILAIWKHTFPLCRPRMRLQSPTIVFKPSATLQPSKDESRSNEVKDPYLPSGLPSSVNLLESLKSDPLVKGAKPSLSAARLSRLSPSVIDGDSIDRTIKIGAQKPLRALPAVSSRVRYSRENGTVGKPSIIASLDIETAPFSDEIVELTAIDMELSDGKIEDLSKSFLPLLPLKCQPKDNAVFLFRLRPNEASPDTSNQTSARTVLVTLHATVFVSPTSRPKIEMRWKTGVDFSTALNPIYGTPGQSMQRQRRPNNLSRTLSNNNANNTPASVREPDSASGSTQKRQRAVSVSEFGVSITITAPDVVRVGQPFHWEVLVLNGSSKPRQLALTVLPKHKKLSTTGHTSKSAPIPIIDSSNFKNALAVIDEVSLYTMQRSVGVDVGDVIGLSTDVRIGTLNPGCCIDTKLMMLPLTTGYLELEAIKLIDSVSHEAIHIRDLPDIFVEDEMKDEES